MLEALLALEGHVVRSETRGVGAVQAAEEFAPDIDGYEVAPRIRALHQVPAPRLIAVSGYGQPRDQNWRTKRGMTSTWSSPSRRTPCTASLRP